MRTLTYWFSRITPLFIFFVGYVAVVLFLWLLRGEHAHLYDTFPYLLGSIAKYTFLIGPFIAGLLIQIKAKTSSQSVQVREYAQRLRKQIFLFGCGMLSLALLAHWFSSAEIAACIRNETGWCGMLSSFFSAFVVFLGFLTSILQAVNLFQLIRTERSSPG